ncbi:NKAP domain containing 1 [Oncorhynchus keta]|uniref:NKAP domain containing 1 n=1 Tax=Oncorhynchus keta TaxID=8018 RepID=UPI0015F93815|nr:NKAP domain containing 1 [Oncorhynchus keta]
MSRVPMGKVLLRNVIRHTDAHNKIQEESEMWKLRWMEKGPSTSHRPMPPSSNPSRSHMHCDRVEDGSVDRLGDRLRRREHSSGQDEREARYWTKELYDFEANDPDRWGHSGFKELYPEEFKSDWERDRGDDQNGHCRKKKTKSRLKTAKSKHLKKSSKKKKKKKKKKEESRTGESDGESSSDSVKQKRKSNKSKHKRKKSEREEESSSEERGRRSKRQMDSHRDSGPESHKKRKNWKAGADKSEVSSED